MPAARERLSLLSRRLRRSVLRRRRILAAVLIAIGVAAGLQVVSPPPPPSVRVQVAARDLPAGALLSPEDVTYVDFRPDSAPDHLDADPVGQVLAAPLRRGEPVTDVRLVGPDLTAAHPDLVALPVRLPDAAMVALLETGDRIDLVATDPAAGQSVSQSLAGADPTGEPGVEPGPSRGSAGSETIATDVIVLAIPAAAGEAADQSTLPGRLVVVGLEPDDVAIVSKHTVSAYVTFAWSSR